MANELQEFVKRQRAERVKNAVDGIVNDILDRRGLGNEWEAIDKAIQKEIREAWATIIDEAVL